MTIFSHTFFFFLSFCTKNNIYFPALFLYNHTHTCEKQKNKREGCGIQKNPAKKTMKDLIKKWNSISLIKRIICGLIIGLVLGLVVPQASVISILGTMFVGALKGIAPLLVFFLVMSALCHMKSGQKTNLKFICLCSRYCLPVIPGNTDLYRHCFCYRYHSAKRNCGSAHQPFEQSR